ncbi:ankyrin repeat domain-containing protein 49-like [Homarus americanus]|uniref:ankyrin repeat domain-containing protein 49-like n=1 Tax=Homarus americanus TaxID=6706 RepID=UPI001C45E058|nr:ankyrin repeat domain-containing protein 49-like [Homarus americanus]
MSDNEESEEAACEMGSEDIEEPERPLVWTSGWDDESNDVEADPDPHATPEREILWACENGKQSLVEEILQQHPEAISATDSDGYTPLHRAAYSDFPDIIKLLLSAGASVNAKTVDGWSALHSACRWNHFDCVVILIDGGSDVNGVTNSGQTPLHVAAINPQAHQTLQLLLMNCMVKPLLTNSNGETAKDLAMRSGPHGYLFEVTDPVLNVCEDHE